MLSGVPEWCLKNWIEITGAVLGLLYILFSIRQNILTWPTGFLTAVFYIFVFLNSKIYATMALQVYYAGISVYGWLSWRGFPMKENKKELPVTGLSKPLIIILLPITALIYVLIFFILTRFTDSPVPLLDSLITSLSIIGTWMLARKILEHWLIWIAVDGISVALFIFKELWPSAVLFLVYTILAIFGYAEWKKTIVRNG